MARILRKMAEEWDRRSDPAELSKRTFQQPSRTPQNNFCRLAEDIKQQKSRPIVFKTASPSHSHDYELSEP